MQLLEDMPHRFHEVDIHGLVIILEVNPPSKPVNNIFPNVGISHDNVPALFIVVFDAHIEDLLFCCDFELLINLVFNWQPVTIPTKSSRNEMSSLASIPTDNIFNGSCSDVAVVRSACSKGGSIIKCEGREVLCFL